MAPDYEGLGTPGVHPYLNLSSEAKSALAAVKAVKEHYGAQLKGDWMSIGQSQGGHASLGTAEFANTDASYKGAVAGHLLQVWEQSFKFILIRNLILIQTENLKK